MRVPVTWLSTLFRGATWDSGGHDRANPSRWGHSSGRGCTASAQNVAAHVGNGVVTISWPDNSALDLSGYNVYRNGSRHLSMSAC
jgi:hypothetical protein